MMVLNGRQLAFVEHYVRCGNATEAAKAAGYSAKTAYSIGSRLLKNVELAEEIRRRIGELHMDAPEVLMRLSEQARASMDDFTNDSGELDLAKAKQNNHFRFVKKFKVTERPGKYGETVITEVELYDAQGALSLLARHLGLLNDKLHITGTLQSEALPKLSNEDLDEMERILSRAADTGASPG